MKAINGAVEVKDIQSSLPNFSMDPGAFLLNQNETKTIKLKFKALDSNYNCAKFTINSNGCESSYYATSNLLLEKSKTNILKFIKTTDSILPGHVLNLKWEGIAPDDTLALYYRADKGLNWNLISNKASNYSYLWTLPDTTVCDSIIIKGEFIDFKYEPNLNMNRICENLNSEYGAISKCRNGDIIYAGSDFLVYYGIIQRFTQTGKILFSKKYGGSNEDFFNNAIELLNGNLLFSGFSFSNDGDLNPRDSNDSKPHLWILSTDSLGNKKWSIDFIQTYYEVPFLFNGSNNQTVLFGNSNDKKYPFPLDKTIYIISVDSLGNISSTKGIGGSKDDVLLKVIRSRDNGYILAGTTTSSDGDMKSKNVGNIFVLKLDSAFNLLWSNRVGDLNSVELLYLDETKDENLFIVGRYYNSKLFTAVMNTKGELINYDDFNEQKSNVYFYTYNLGDKYYLFSQYYIYTPTEQKNIFYLNIYDSRARLIAIKQLPYKNDNAEIKNIVPLNSQSYRGFLFRGSSVSMEDFVLYYNSIDESRVSYYINKGTSPKDSSIVLSDISLAANYYNLAKDTLLSNTIRNISDNPVTIKKIFFSGVNASSFSLFKSDSIVIPAKSYVRIGLVYTPRIVGLIDANMNVVTLNNDTLSCNISAVSLQPTFETLRNVFYLDSAKINNTIEKSLYTYKNVNKSPVKMKSCKILGIEGKAFSLVTDLDGYFIDPNVNKSVSIRFNPKLRKNYYDYLVLTSDDNVPIKVLLSGIGCDSVFTPQDSIPIVENPNGAKILNISPSPSYKNAKISYTVFSRANCELKIINSIGMLMEYRVIESPKTDDINVVDIDVSGYAPGKYIAILESNNESIKYNFIVLK